MKKMYFILMLLILGMSGVVNGTIYRVTPTGAGTKDGSSWENAKGGYDDANTPFRSLLQKAIDDAADGDEIWVAAGTYYPCNKTTGLSSTEKAISFSLKQGCPFMVVLTELKSIAPNETGQPM